MENYIALKNIFSSFSKGFSTTKGQKLRNVQFKRNVVVRKFFFGLIKTRRDVLLKNEKIIAEFEFLPKNIETKEGGIIKFDTTYTRFTDPNLLAEYGFYSRIVMFLDTNSGELEIYNRISNWENHLYLNDKDFKTVLDIIRKGNIKDLDDYYVDLTACKLIHRSEI